MTVAASPEKPQSWRLLFTRKFRAGVYLTTMGTGISTTMTQLNDTAFAAFEGGLMGTPVEYLSAVLGISETKIEPDLGLGDNSH